MAKYTTNQLTKYAEKIGFVKPKVWYSKIDPGWWLETDSVDEYLSVDSSGAKNKLTELCEGILVKAKQTCICSANDLQPFGECICKKKNHGGKRKGSGRPKKEPTKVMRIPISLISHVVGLIKNR